MLFQFHFGTIESPASSEVVFAVPEFQFHFGTIKSWLNMDLSRINQISIPLWYDWKDLAADMSSVSYRNFNSTLVRLKEVLGFSEGQNYTISIPHWYDWKDDPLIQVYPEQYFNSTLVRLKEFFEQVCGFKLINFNSTLVRLKAERRKKLL